MIQNRFNYIGFNFYQNPKEYKHCPFDEGLRLVYIEKDDQWLCTKCGYRYLKEEVPTTEKIELKHQKKKSGIISRKKKKKYYSKNGVEINDETLLKDIANGADVIFYNEKKSGENKPCRS